MLVETLSSELERMFELDDLSRLSREALGFGPDELAGSTVKASYARALAQRAVDAEAVEALLDTVRVWRRGLPASLDALRIGHGAPQVLEPGAEVGEYVVLSRLGVGPSASVYRARGGGREVRIKCLHPAVARRRSDAQRYLTAARLAGGVNHPGLPTGVSAGPLEDPDDRLAVVHDAVDGETLSAIMKRSEPRHFNDLLPLLWAIGEPLAALHTAGLTHGSLHAGNVLVADANESAPRVVLLDAGSHLLRPALPSGQNGGIPSWLSAASPEQLRGEDADPRSDLYGFGVLIYELMSGKSPFGGSRAIDAMLEHLTASAEPLSFVAAGRGATPEVQAFVQSLLEKRREQRPRDAVELLEGLRRIWNASTRPPTWVNDERLPELFASLAENPADEEAAASLEASVDLGANAERLADGFYQLAVELRGRRDLPLARAMRRHLGRAARLFEAAGQHTTAEQVYAELLAFDPRDHGAAQALSRIKRKQGRYEELIESLLSQSEHATTPSERARYMSDIAELYQAELGDKDQALVAYAQAVCEDPGSDAHVAAVEHLAGNRYEAWEEVLGRAVEAASSAELPPERRGLLFLMGRWYVEKVARPDLALPWLTRLLAFEPNHDRALTLVGQIYKKAQQWREYGQTLVRRADIVSASLSRELRAEAAEILVSRLSEPAAARDLYAAILEEDPGHTRAAEGLIELLEKARDYAAAVKVREARGALLHGEERLKNLCEIAETYEVYLDDYAVAEQRFREVLKSDPEHLEALRGLDRVLTRAGRYRDLLIVLETQAELAVTARQKIAVYERIAGIYEEEYLDHDKAAHTLERVLELDPTRGDASVALARHYRALERWEDLVALYEKQAAAADDARRVEIQLLVGRVLQENLKQPARAIAAYEAVLAIEPSHAGALDALATLRVAVGDAEQALSAIDELLAKATTPEAKADQHVRAASLLEAQGDRDGALGRYRQAAALCPDDPARRGKLRQKYLEFGHYRAAVELMEDELEHTPGELERARIAGEMARICLRHLQDAERAQRAAQLAQKLDPNNGDALRVLGRLAHAEERYVEAARRLEPVIPELDALEPGDARELGFMYVDSLNRSGESDKALTESQKLMRWFSEDPSALLAILEIAAAHGTAEQTLWMAEQLLGDVRSLLAPGEEAQAELRLGEALGKLERFDDAQAALERAIALDPLSAAPLRALASTYLAQGDYRKLIDALYREYELAEGDRRIELLLEIGDLASARLSDSAYAAKSYLLALGERPDDRTILTKLMQLYGAEKDWPKLVQVIGKLAEVVDDPKHKAKYLHTASMIASRELSDLTLASSLIGAALEQDPDLETALDESISLHQRLADHEGLKDALKLKIAHAERAGDRDALLRLLPELADVYQRLLGRQEQAIAVYESLLALEPENQGFAEHLARLLAKGPPGSHDKAVAAIGAWIERDPYQPEAHKLLRQLYTGARYADAAWCACQALSALGQAEPDETRFFERMRTSEPADIVYPSNAEEWLSHVAPVDFDPYLTGIFALIQPYVVGSRSRPLAAFGLSAEHQISTENYPYGVVRATSQVCQALSMPEPRIYQNPEAPSGVSFLLTAPPALMLGARAFGEDVTPLAAAFLAGRYLAYYVPGLYVRQLLPNMTALKAWLFAAIRLVRDKFPVGEELEAPVSEASEALTELGSGTRLEQLTHVVSKLLSDGASLDLRRWVHGVDLAADASAFVFANDLEVAIDRLRSLPQDWGAPQLTTRVERLVAYAVSPRYLGLRERLGLRIDG